MYCKMTEMAESSKVSCEDSIQKPNVSSTRPTSLVQKTASVPVEYFKVREFQATNCIDKLTFMLVRPPRITYDDRLLVPPPRDPRFKYTVENVPFPVSIYTPNSSVVDYHILYLHGNSSSRL